MHFRAIKEERVIKTKRKPLKKEEEEFCLDINCICNLLLIPKGCLKNCKY